MQVRVCTSFARRFKGQQALAVILVDLDDTIKRNEYWGRTGDLFRIIVSAQSLIVCPTYQTGPPSADTSVRPRLFFLRERLQNIFSA